MTIPQNDKTSDVAADNAESEEARADRVLIDRLLAERQLIVASNRGPVTFSERSEGVFSSRQGSGGLVTAVSAVLQDHEAIWIAAAMTDGDRKRATYARENDEAFIVPEDSSTQFKLRFVEPSHEAYHQYYNVISNPLLWFLQHYLWDTPRSPDITHETWAAWRDGYVVVNQLFADEIADACAQFETEPVVMLQDYHLYLVARSIRDQRPGAILYHFTHIPWPDPDYWRLIPYEMRRQICEGLLSCDIVGFQTPDHARSFMYTCEAYVPDVDVDYVERQVTWKGHTVDVRAYPISIDTEAVRKTAYSQEARTYERYLPTHWNEFTILRVDRAEPSKNIIRGFHAYDRFLELHPDFQNRVNFIAVTQPSRMDVKEYREYLDDMSAIVGRINAKYANVETGWQPVSIIMGESYPRVLAAMKWYDVLMVNSVIDGMNLVAKEGALINERNGVIILSEGAGAAAQLSDSVLMVSPADIEGTAIAIYEALTMPFKERQRRAHLAREAVEQEDVSIWFEKQLSDIGRLRALTAETGSAAAS